VGGIMSGWQFLISAWDLEPSILIGCAALLIGYAAAQGFRLTRRAWAFAGGVGVLLLALVSPLDTLADDYLFSAHMLQHILLMLVAPLLLWIGIPPILAERAFNLPVLGAAERLFRRPLVAWWIGVATLWVWHWPPLFALALHHEWLHIVQHLCFMAAGFIFWWPVLSPLQRDRIRPHLGVFYLFIACLGDTVLGIVVTFGRPGLFPDYTAPEDPFGILPAIRGWGLTAAADQQLGGLFMWGGCCLVYVSVAMALIARWFREEEEGVAEMNVPAARTSAPLQEHLSKPGGKP
jgi:putative membrane protein